MIRQSRQATTPRNNVVNTVRNWLQNESGFTLEMRAAAVFRRAGFEVRQSSLYLDTETGKWREIDLIAKDPDPTFMGIIAVYFAIECKSSKKPWILLTSPDTLVGYSRFSALGVLSKEAETAFGERLLRESAAFIDTLPWLRKGIAGYAFRQAHSDQQDRAYSAAISVAKACEFLAHHPEHRFPRFILAFPVIVIDTPLVQCGLARGSKLNLRQVKQGEFLFLARLPGFFGSCIRVVTLEGLPAFAREAKRAAGEFRAALKREQEEVEKSLGLPIKQRARKGARVEDL
jgi:hypothetical protein